MEEYYTLLSKLINKWIWNQQLKFIVSGQILYKFNLG